MSRGCEPAKVTGPVPGYDGGCSDGRRATAPAQCLCTATRGPAAERPTAGWAGCVPRFGEPEGSGAVHEHQAVRHRGTAKNRECEVSAGRQYRGVGSELNRPPHRQWFSPDRGTQKKVTRPGQAGESHQTGARRKKSPDRREATAGWAGCAPRFSRVGDRPSPYVPRSSREGDRPDACVPRSGEPGGSGAVHEHQAVRHRGAAQNRESKVLGSRRSRSLDNSTFPLVASTAAPDLNSSVDHRQWFSPDRGTQDRSPVLLVARTAASDPNSSNCPTGNGSHHTAVHRRKSPDRVHAEELRQTGSTHEKFA